MKALFFCMSLLVPCLAASAGPAAAAATAPPGPPGPERITRDWWLAASDAQRGAFVSASSEAYQVGRNDAYYAILEPLDNSLGRTQDLKAHATLLQVVTVARQAVPLVLFPKPASFYASQITRFYNVAPSNVQLMSPATVLICMAEGLDAERARFCSSIEPIFKH